MSNTATRQGLMSRLAASDRRDPHAIWLPAARPQPLSALAGSWRGAGFNAVFRPTGAPSRSDQPLDLADGGLELNLTEESLAFLPSLAPRADVEGPQDETVLDGVPYVQIISDVTTGPRTGLLFEPAGVWLGAPSVAYPPEPVTVARVSTAAGTTKVARGVALPATRGAPTIAAMDMAPFRAARPSDPIALPSGNVTTIHTARRPQDLSSFVKAGTITQAMLDDPNNVLRDQIRHQTIDETAIIRISTHPGTPLPRGPLSDGGPLASASPSVSGRPAEDLLHGLSSPRGNAQLVQVDAVFWIETVIYEVVVPPIACGSPPIVLSPVPVPGAAVEPKFLVTGWRGVGQAFAGGTIRVSARQIQYAQKIVQTIDGLCWPHVTVATLVPAEPVVIPTERLLAF